ncbi:28S ribosomal protein S22, mitochondrial [Nymphon striatum]|nr:28S ribosomal protein S22, mitochondrial [Nymphon striatum]
MNFLSVYFLDSSTSSTKEKIPLFINPNVQNILKSLTIKDVKKVYGTKKLKELSIPKYKFMTDKQLKAVEEEAMEKMDDVLQMPPVMNEREEIDEIISNDPGIKGALNHRTIFTDISYGLDLYERTVVVREPDGILREATWEERIRMHYTYLPDENRPVLSPSMLQPEHIHIPLDSGKYEYVLDRACYQFEPDDPDYIRVCHTVYAHVRQQNKFDDLRMTRHFGPMIFHFVVSKTMDDVLVHFLNKEDTDAVFSSLKLYKIIHPESSFIMDDKSLLNSLKSYMENDSFKKSKLENAIQTYIESQKKKLSEKI